MALKLHTADDTPVTKITHLSTGFLWHGYLGESMTSVPPLTTNIPKSFSEHAGEQRDYSYSNFLPI